MLAPYTPPGTMPYGLIKNTNPMAVMAHPNKIAVQLYIVFFMFLGFALHKFKEKMENLSVSPTENIASHPP